MANEASVVFDFDGTLTPKGDSLFQKVDAFTLSPAGKREAARMREKYMARALGDGLPAADELLWLEDSLGLYIADGLCRDEVEASLESVALRPGVAECFGRLREADIPIAVVSYSVADFIRVVLNNNRISDLIDRIYAAEMLCDCRGVYDRYRKDTLVTPGNKAFCSRHFAERVCGLPYARQWAVGDSGADRGLGYCQEQRFGFAANEKDATKLRKFMAEVDVGSDDFAPALRWLARHLSL